MTATLPPLRSKLAPLSLAPVAAASGGAALPIPQQLPEVRLGSRCGNRFPPAAFLACRDTFRVVATRPVGGPETSHRTRARRLSAGNRRCRSCCDASGLPRGYPSPPLGLAREDRAIPTALPKAGLMRGPPMN